MALWVQDGIGRGRGECMSGRLRRIVFCQLCAARRGLQFSMIVAAERPRIGNTCGGQDRQKRTKPIARRLWCVMTPEPRLPCPSSCVTRLSLQRASTRVFEMNHALIYLFLSSLSGNTSVDTYRKLVLNMGMRSQ